VSSSQFLRDPFYSDAFGAVTAEDGEQLPAT
jgi:hypothetical protein